ncbi:hypothetical protein STEG23_004105, partial [Scotinomys teguina]
MSTEVVCKAICSEQGKHWLLYLGQGRNNVKGATATASWTDCLSNVGEHLAACLASATIGHFAFYYTNHSKYIVTQCTNISQHSMKL